MKIKGERAFAAPRERVWEVLLDPEVIARCIPGCQRLEAVDADTFEATLKIGVGAVSGTYEGALRIQERIPPCRYAMSFEGTGRGGFVRGTGVAELRERDGATVVAYDCDVEVGGLIASVGQRVLEGVSGFLVGQMFTKLQGYAVQEAAS